MRSIVTWPMVLLAALLSTLVMGGSAQAQTGEVYVPPGYGDGAARTDGATVVVPSTTGAGGYAVTGTVSSYPLVPVVTPVPHQETRTRETSIRALWIPGLIALPVSWLLTWTISSTGLPLDGDAIEYSFIPVIGPWLMLTQPLNGYEGFAVAMGIVQDVAAIMLILGLVLRETVEETVWVMSDLGEGRTLAFDASGGPGGGMANATLTF